MDEKSQPTANPMMYFDTFTFFVIFLSLRLFIAYCWNIVKVQTDQAKGLLPTRPTEYVADNNVDYQQGYIDDDFEKLDIHIFGIPG
jgi:hypothetical protein